MTTSSLPGAGAWTRVPVYSRTTCGATIPAKYLVEPGDTQRIRWAAGAIQTELDHQQRLSAGAHTGKYGSLTDIAIRAYQKDYGLTVDGKAGPKTLRQLCWPVILWTQEKSRVKIPGNLLYGMLALESGMDPGAQGVNRLKSTDMGLAQISDVSNPDVTPAQAYGDIRWAIHYAAYRLIESKQRGTDTATYADRGLWDCAVAAHNNPTKARAWADTGTAPDDQIATYVRLVRKYGADHP